MDCKARSSGLIWNMVIDQTKSAGVINAPMLLRRKALPNRMSAIARYIGLRLIRYSPVVTNVFACSGSTGLTVVRARANAISARMRSITPAAIRTDPAYSNKGKFRSNAGRSMVIPHIRRPHIRNWITGGIRRLMISTRLRLSDAAYRILVRLEPA